MNFFNEIKQRNIEKAFGDPISLLYIDFNEMINTLDVAQN